MGGLAGFLKKRAPFYLAGVALVAVFIVPELTKSDLADSFAGLGPEERQAVDVLMGYNGPDGDGLTLLDAISAEIEEEYPGERIYDHRRTEVKVGVEEQDPGSYRITLGFASYKGELYYDWNIDGSGMITSNNEDSRHVIGVVDFYD